MVTKPLPSRPESHINLQGGWPTPRLHPLSALQAASTALLSRPDATVQLTYGPEAGSLALRTNIGRWLSTCYRAAPDPDGDIPAPRILVTNGASNGLATILQKFTDPAYTRGVWMVEPTYFLACPIVRDAGLGGTTTIRGVPEGEDGVDLDVLQRGMEERDAEAPAESEGNETPRKTPENGYPKLYRHIVYAIPTFSNPSGRTMTRASRERLVRIARKHNALLVTDDVYDVLRWRPENAPGTRTTSAGRDDCSDPGLCPPRLVDIDRDLPRDPGDGPLTAFGNAVSNGSFSKIVAPGVRVGWLEGAPALIAAMGTVGANGSGGCQSHFASLILNELLASGALAHHIATVLVPTYRARHHAMTAAIRAQLYPLGVRIVADSDPTTSLAGGFFLYVSFDGCHRQGKGRKKLGGAEVARVALDEFNLKIAPGQIFTVPDDPESAGRSERAFANGARLCWAWHEEDELVEGIGRLRGAVERVLRRNEERTPTWEMV